jgi:hypothetical protein
MCFDIANVNVQEEFRGKGIFTEWLTKTIRLVLDQEFDAIYVENVLNPRLAMHFRNRGKLDNIHCDMIEQEDSEISSFYILKRK